jgi:hypothetical protein
MLLDGKMKQKTYLYGYSTYVVHTYVHTYIHTHIHTHTHAHIHTFMYTYPRVLLDTSKMLSIEK